MKTYSILLPPTTSPVIQSNKKGQKHSVLKPLAFNLFYTLFKLIIHHS